MVPTASLQSNHLDGIYGFGWMAKDWNTIHEGLISSLKVTYDPQQHLLWKKSLMGFSDPKYNSRPFTFGALYVWQDSIIRKVDYSRKAMKSTGLWKDVMDHLCPFHLTSWPDFGTFSHNHELHQSVVPMFSIGTASIIAMHTMNINRPQNCCSWSSWLWMACRDCCEVGDGYRGGMNWLGPNAVQWNRIVHTVGVHHVFTLQIAPQGAGLQYGSFWAIVSYI